MSRENLYQRLLREAPIGEPWASQYWKEHRRICAYCGQEFIPRHYYQKYCASTRSEEDDLYNPACTHGRWVESLSRKQFVEQIMGMSVEEFIQIYGYESYKSL